RHADITDRGISHAPWIPRQMNEVRGPNSRVVPPRQRRSEEPSRDVTQRGCAESVGEHVTEARVTTGDVQLCELDGGRQERPAEKAAPPRHAGGREGGAEREKEEDVDEGVGDPALATEHAPEPGLRIAAADREQGGAENRGHRRGEEPALLEGR